MTGLLTINRVVLKKSVLAVPDDPKCVPIGVKGETSEENLFLMTYINTHTHIEEEKKYLSLSFLFLYTLRKKGKKRNNSHLLFTALNAFLYPD